MPRGGRAVRAAIVLSLVVLASPLVSVGSAHKGREPRLRTEGPAARGAPLVRYAPGELLVRFRPATPTEAMRAAASRAEGTITGSVSALTLHAIKVPVSRVERALASLRSEPSVQSAEREVLLEAFDTVPNDELWSTQWGSRIVGAPVAWDASRGAPGVVIAVLDTGVDSRHADLAGATVPGRDFVDDDDDPSDVNGHGTAAAGIVAARTNNREGQSGVCWACSLMPVRVLDRKGAGKTSTVAAGIVWAVDNGATVLNLSLGGPQSTSALRAAVDYAATKGVVLVAAAGNSGLDTPIYPAAYDEVIGVAASTEEDVLYDWSNRGSWIGVAAPGCNTAPRAGGGYIEFCGTSSAAPIVAGIAGLAIALNPMASRAEVSQAIDRSVTPLADVAPFGRVNAPAVLGETLTRGTATPTEAPAAAPPPLPPASMPPQPSPPALTVPPARAVGPVVAVRPPRLRGLARVGLDLRVIPGTWAPNAHRFTYTWQRCSPSGARCRTISGARSGVYRLKRLDRGRRLRAVVVASNAIGAVSALTGASSIVRTRPAKRPRR